MSNVIKLSDYRADPWKEVFTVDGPNSTLQVYVNTRTGEAEIVQMNDDNEAIRTPLDASDVEILLAVLARNTVNKGSGS